MPGKKFSLIVALTAAGLLLLPVLAFEFIPDQILEQTTQRLLAEQGISMHATRFRSSFPAGIKAEGLSLGDATTTALKVDRLLLRLRLLPLLIGKVSCSLSADIGETGKLSGMLTVTPRLSGDVTVSTLELQDLPILTNTLGNGIRGTTRLEVTMDTAPKSGAVGNARLSIANLTLKGVTISGMPLPNAVFPTVRGLIKLKGQTLQIENLALEGDGIYLRLTGSTMPAPNAPLNLTLELLPSAELLRSQQTVFLLMLPYQVSPGHYRLPIGGTLASPQLSKR